MKRNLLFGLLLLSFAILTMFGCGGGGGGDSAPTTTVSGTVAKGLVSGSTVQVFEIISSHNPAKARIAGTALTQGATAADGSFAINIGGSIIKGGLLLKATGGTYRDEATGANATLTTLNAAFGNISGMVRRGQGVTVNVTPLTEMGFRAIGSGNRPTDANIAAANGKVVSTLGLTGVNIITTKPVPADVAAPAGASAAQIDYGLALAVVSQMMKQGKTLEQIAAEFATDIQAGVLSPDNDAAGSVATLNFLNSPFNKAGVADGITVSVAANKPRAVVTSAMADKAVLTATVKQGTDIVPDGTEVTFRIKSGAGASLSTASATTVKGVASVDLTGTTVGAQVVVEASAGGIKGDAPAILFINQPTEAVVTVSLTGTLPAGSLIGGVDARIAFAANKGLSAPSVQKIGIGLAEDAQVVTNTNINPVIIPAAWTNGTNPGDVVRLTFPIAAGNFPTAADFTVDSASTVIDLNNGSLDTAIDVSISFLVQ
jgi:hypothetical protein